MKIINNGGKCEVNKAFSNLQHFDPKPTIVSRGKEFLTFGIFSVLVFQISVLESYLDIYLFLI